LAASAAFSFFAGGIMEIFVNGETHDVGPISVAALLEAVGIDARRVAVELNLEILPKTDYGSTLLQEGDRLEVVHFVGGG
jgi:sulfur carrier protein